MLELIRPHLAMLLLLGALAAVLTCLPRPAHALYGQCKWENGPGAPTNPSCVVEDCTGNGGVAQCTEPQIAPTQGTNAANVDGQKFTYGDCDYEAPSIGASDRWCIVEGGTVQGPDNSCVNLPVPFNTGGPNSESLAIQIANQWESWPPGICSNSISSDSGWGYNDSGDLTCGGSQGYQNGTLLRDVRKLVYAPQCNGTATIIMTKHRQLACPAQYYSRTLPNGNLQCWLPAEACLRCGNPVSPVTGAKLQDVIDYRGAGGGALEFHHYYNSAGLFRFPGSGPFISTFSDYWRFSYQRQLTLISGNATLTGVLRREDGTVEQFDGSGHEILNRTGAADRLASSGSGWTITLANNDVETYNASGNLVSYTTSAGFVTTINYGTNGLISSISDSFGHKLTLSYNGLSQLTTVTLPDGQHTISYGYDPTLGRLSSVTYPDGTSNTYQYEDLYNAWLLSGITDENNQRYGTYRYNAQGVVIHEEHAGGVASYNFSIGSDPYYWNIDTQVTDPLGQVRTYALYNVNGVYRIGSSQPYCSDCPNVASLNYDANGNPQSRYDLNWNETTYTYDETRNLELSRTEGLATGGVSTSATRTITTQWHPTFRRPAQISTYAGATATGTALQTTNFTYDGYANLLSKTITDGTTGATRTWTYQYYNSGLYGQVQTVTGPRTDVSSVTSYTYYNCATGGGCGQVQTVRDALGHVTTYNTYDANGYPLTITDPNGTVTQLTYDLRQRLTSRTVGGELTQYFYYPTGLLKQMVRPDGSYLTYIYDAAHRLTEIDDSLGNRLVYTLDGAGNRQVEQRYNASGTLVYTHTQLYNQVGQLWQDLTASASEAQATVYGYDAAGNQSNVAAPLSRTTTNQFDALSRLAQITDPNQGITQMGYDVLDDLASVTDPRKLTTNYTSNGFGDVTQLQSPDTGTTGYTYDSGGNLKTAKDARGDQATNAYDALNRLTGTVYTDQSWGFNYDQGTDGIGRLTSVTDATGGTNLQYDGLGRVRARQETIGSVTLSIGYVYTNGQLTSLTTPSGQVITYSYNGNNQVSSISLNGSALISNATYMPFGPVSGWTWGNGTSTSRSFDIDGNLTSISSAGTSTYTFNDDRSIATRSDSWPSAYGLETGSTTLTVSPTSNQIASTSGTLSRAYGYDPAGHTTTLGAATFGYADSGRMTGASVTAGTVTYAVNALGQRVGKTTPAGTTLFAYDESGHLLGEYNAQGKLIEETIWLGDVPVATLQATSGGGTQLFYVHTDHLNSPRRLSRPTDNVVVWQWDSDPYGASSAEEDPDGDGVLTVYNLRFPGQYFDNESGLQYNYFRDYDSQTGRYVESDPVGIRGGMNTYSYANQNPLSYWDPNGLAPSPVPRSRSRTRNCNSDEYYACEQMCAPRGVESCKVSQTWRIKTIKGGLAGWGWYDGPMSCSCKEGNFCSRNPKTCTAGALLLGIGVICLAPEVAPVLAPAL
jgi:RHS repeat-associated protein